jgi:hypothetical protein
MLLTEGTLAFISNCKEILGCEFTEHMYEYFMDSTSRKSSQSFFLILYFPESIVLLTLHSSLKETYKANYSYRFSSYRAVNTLLLKNQLVNYVLRHNNSVFWDPYNTHE